MYINRHSLSSKKNIPAFFNKTPYFICILDHYIPASQNQKYVQSNGGGIYSIYRYQIKIPA